MITKAWISYLVYKTRMRMKETPPASMRKEKTRTIAVDIVLTRAYALHQQDIDKWTASAISPRPLQGVDVDIHVLQRKNLINQYCYFSSTTGTKSTSRFLFGDK
jgi:hypothetical protein